MRAMYAGLAAVALGGCSAPPARTRAAAPVEPTAFPPGAPVTAPPEAAELLAVELSRWEVKMTLPAVPRFELPTVAPGRHSVQELWVRGDALLDTELAVEGYVTWIYDCVADVERRTGASRARARRDIEDKPTLCRRPAFYIGAMPDTSPETSIWVVEVPRPMTRAERENLPRDMIEAWPKVPKLTVGERVIVRGYWQLRSPHGESNSAGLLVYVDVGPYRGQP